MPALVVIVARPYLPQAISHESRYERLAAMTKGQGHCPAITAYTALRSSV
jgi:hypothetical protein